MPKDDDHHHHRLRILDSDDDPHQEAATHLDQPRLIQRGMSRFPL